MPRGATKRAKGEASSSEAGSGSGSGHHDAKPSAKKLRATFHGITDEQLLVEVERRGLTERVRHAAVEATVRANYEVGKVLGEGSSAKVFAAKHRGSGEGFAIKWIDKGGEMNDAETMATEVSILKALHHKNIVNLHEVYESESTLWLVMEVVAGGELLEYLCKQRHLSEAYVRDIAKQLCQGLHYIHAAGVVHRDLKLENVLRASDHPSACVKIADFGLAAVLPRFKKHNFVADASARLKASTRLKDLWGTPQYFAPELIGQAYGTQVDVWSLGCVLYELLSGHKLFGEDLDFEGFWDDEAKQQSLFSLIQRGPAAAAAFAQDRWDASISAECRDFVMQLCTVSALERPSAGEALRHAWLDAAHKPATHHMEAAHAKLISKAEAKARARAKAARTPTGAHGRRKTGSKEAAALRRLS